ncbi:serine/threonine-protein kinase [Nocardioides yefusunii]|uniref:Serine/threonine-protein kinase n=1 Tax=Nocardioides yefusunii TaxID=2500546 RepID=A0ABW1QSR3_9ACTN|nr:serine/threonine-protein kinase [Nocardioides yefusunii]
MTASAAEPRRRPDLDVGDRITPDLTAVRLLGGGSAFEAWLAFDELTHLPVVVKVLRPDLRSNAVAREALAREVRALAEINHPVVVRGLRHDLEGERPHVVLENIDGPRLSTLVRRYGPLQPQQYLTLGIDLAAALHYLGRTGWVHLDVKPSNIIMGAPARLIDLSVARRATDAAALTTPVGTDPWMAPEQCAPREWAVPGAASDVWALGATLHTAISGTRPFPDASPENRFPQLALAPTRLDARVPAPVREVVEACLALRCEDRPQAAEIADALEPVLAAQPVGQLTYRVR